MTDETYAVYDTAMGQMTVACGKGAVTALGFGAVRFDGVEKRTPLSDETARQLGEYFAGRRRSFDLPLHPEGTPFQLAVWQALTAIAYGETRSYGEIAAQIGREKACRAVGMANHRNRLPILIPCHRVVGRDGSLTGYAGGLDRKKRLLALEQKDCNVGEDAG